MGRRGRARALAGGVAMVVGILSAGPTLAGDGSAVHARRVREVCHLPRSGNPQHVLGFDTGFSFTVPVAGRPTAFWAVGDSLIDLNGDGVFVGEGLGFRAGTIARTTDLDARNCVDLTLRTTNGADVIPGIQNPTGPCLTWPGRPFEANDKLYFFYNSGDCAPGPAGTRLARVTNPATGEMAIVRVGSETFWPAGGNVYNGALKVGGRVYVFSHVGSSLRVARVAEAQIEDPGAFEYRTASGWSSLPGDATPLFGDIYAPPAVAYFAPIDRFLMIYQCGFGGAVCARTSKATGNSEHAVGEAGWNAATFLLNSPWPGHAWWHGDYRDPSDPNRIYLTTARFPGVDYWLTLYEIDLATDPAPPTTISTSLERGFSTENGGASGWSYASYTPSQPATTLVNLPTLVPVQPDPPPKTPPAPPWPVWVGSETADGPAAPGVTAAPGVFRLGMYPSPTRAAAAVWTVPGTGLAQVSGEGWLERTCGSGATLEILRLRGPTAAKVWRKRLVPGWKRQRARRLFNQRFAVNAGDRILIGVKAGATSACDLTYVIASIVVDTSS